MEQDKQEQQTAAISLGAELRTEREARGLSMGEVADRLKLSLKQLRAIEDGDFSRLPGAPFARGFVRSYARFLELDSDSLLARLDACVPLNRPQASPGQDASPAPSRSLALPASLGLLLLLGAAWLLWPHAPAPVLAPHGAQLQASAAPAVPPVAVPASAPSVPAAPVAAVAASAPAAAVGMKTIDISSKASAWVSIVDGSGKKLLFETLPAGSSRHVQGQAPFRLKVGNAAQVSLSYNGQAVDMSGKIRGTTAKLELN